MWSLLKLFYRLRSNILSTNVSNVHYCYEIFTLLTQQEQNGYRLWFQKFIYIFASFTIQFIEDQFDNENLHFSGTIQSLLFIDWFKTYRTVLYCIFVCVHCTVINCVFAPYAVVAVVYFIFDNAESFEVLWRKPSS